MNEANRQVVGLVINFRDAARSARCIHSLLDQSMPVLVWDNSADGGASAREIKQTFPHADQIQIHISPDNLGFAAGVNRAAALCLKLYPSSWILIINNDALLRLDGMVKLRDALIQNPNALLAFPDIDHGGVIYGARYYQRAMGLILSRPGPGRFMYPSGCCLLLASDRFSEVWFDEDFFMYGEDCELGWCLRGSGGGLMIHVPEILVDHEGSASSVTGSVFYESRIAAAHWILAEKLSLGRFDKILLYAGRSVTLVTRAIFRSIRFRSLSPWVGLRQGVIIAFERKSTGKRPIG